MKKKVLPLAAAGLLTMPAYAQQAAGPGLQTYPTDKGSFMAGASFMDVTAGFANGTSRRDGYYSINASPQVGYFVADNLLLGVSLNGTFEGRDYYDSRSGGVGLFGRYYFGKSANSEGRMRRFRFFTEAGGGISTGRTRSRFGSGGEQKHFFSSAGFHVMPGVNYFLTKNIALEAGISYYRSYKLNRGQAYLDPSGIGLHLGVQVFIPGKKAARKPVGVMEE